MTDLEIKGEIQKARRLFKLGLLDEESFYDRVGSLSFELEAPYNGPYIDPDVLYKYLHPSKRGGDIAEEEASYPLNWDIDEYK